MGRKAIEWSASDIEKVVELAKIFCTKSEVAAVMGISEKTLDRLLNKNKAQILPEIPRNQSITYRDVFEHYSAAGRASLRREQYQMALAGDKDMLKLLGKQYLGQTDTHTVQVNASASVKGDVIDAMSDKYAKGRGAK